MQHFGDVAMGSAYSALFLIFFFKGIAKDAVKAAPKRSKHLMRPRGKAFAPESAPTGHILPRLPGFAKGVNTSRSVTPTLRRPTTDKRVIKPMLPLGNQSGSPGAPNRGFMKGSASTNRDKYTPRTPAQEKRMQRQFDRFD